VREFRSAKASSWAVEKTAEGIHLRSRSIWRGLLVGSRAFKANSSVSLPWRPNGNDENPAIDDGGSIGEMHYRLKTLALTKGRDWAWMCISDSS
jgi:hypothetical protein